MKEILKANNNFVKIVDIIKSTTHFHIIMEYCNGRNLEDLIEARGFLREDEVHYLIK